MREILILEKITKTYELYGGSFFTGIAHRGDSGKIIKALDNVDFILREGECVGIIGPNGAGKSTLLRVMAGTVQPSGGTVKRFGKITPLLSLATGFNDELNACDNVRLYGSATGYRGAALDRMSEEVLEFAGLEEWKDVPLKYYSSGMYARLAFSTAVAFKPEILLIDEILLAGDMEFQNKSLNAVKNLVKKARGVVIVSHSLTHLSTLVSRLVFMSKGRVVKEGSFDTVVSFLRSQAEKFSTDESKGGEEREGNGKKRENQKEQAGSPELPLEILRPPSELSIDALVFETDIVRNESQSALREEWEKFNAEVDYWSLVNSLAPPPHSSFRVDSPSEFEGPFKFSSFTCFFDTISKKGKIDVKELPVPFSDSIKSLFKLLDRPPDECQLYERKSVIFNEVMETTFYDVREVAPEYFPDSSPWSAGKKWKCCSTAGESDCGIGFLIPFIPPFVPEHSTSLEFELALSEGRWQLTLFAEEETRIFYKSIQTEGGMIKVSFDFRGGFTAFPERTCENRPLTRVDVIELVCSPVDREIFEVRPVNISIVTEKNVQRSRVMAAALASFLAGRTSERKSEKMVEGYSGEHVNLKCRHVSVDFDFLPSPGRYSDFQAEKLMSLRNMDEPSIRKVLENKPEFYVLARRLLASGAHSKYKERNSTFPDTTDIACRILELSLKGKKRI